MTADAAAEAARILADIRTLTTQADELLVQLRDSGMSWGDLATLIDPAAPARSSAQRRVESARRRQAGRAEAEALSALREAGRTLALPLLRQVTEALTPGGRPRITDLPAARLRDAADRLRDAAQDQEAARDSEIRERVIWAAGLLDTAAHAVRVADAITDPRPYREALDWWERRTVDPADREAMLWAAGLGPDPRADSGGR